MRTHLLRTVYPSAAVEAIEPDTGCAANDDDASSPVPEAKTAQPLLALVSSAALQPDDHDDYYLGGYAGI
ncbi:MAG TPA: hypothetical protein VGC55_05020 [Dokdonella sp.]